MTKSKFLVVTILLLVILAITLVYTTYASVNVTKNISSTGSINVSANLGIYSDSACQNALTTINWGNIAPGGTTTQTVYVKNTGSGASLSLSLTTSNWTPSNANGPITITWNQENTRLAPGQSTAAIITLTVSTSITDITNFNVQITITGTQ